MNSIYTGMYLMEDVDGEVTEVLVDVSAPLEKGMEYWILNLEEKEKGKFSDHEFEQYTYPINPVETMNKVGRGVKVKISSTLLIAPKGSPIIESQEQLRFERGLMRDKFFNNVKNTQPGRPETFPKEKTLKWFNELKEKDNFQHDNGAPFKGKIKKEIIKLHTHKDNETGQTMKPSIDTINYHFRKLGLAKS